MSKKIIFNFFKKGFSYDYFKIIFLIILLGKSFIDENFAKTKIKLFDDIDNNNLINKRKKPQIKNQKFAKSKWEIIDNKKFNLKREWKIIKDYSIYQKLIDEKLESIRIADKTSVNSLNRSIVINDNLIGPDISWIVPLGFKWNSKYRFDTSIRGYSRRGNNQSFLNWNGGDGVGEIHFQALNSNKSSMGLNLGIRSVYSGNTGGNSSIGEGLSAGFRFDRRISNSAGYAFGGEQILHFDNLTDTGRNLYLSFSKAWWDENNYSPFPLTIGTFGFGTGKFAEGTIKGLCSDLLGGSGTEIKYQRSLCWSPIFSLARVHNEKISTFFEYNSKWFLIGTSLVPSQEIPLRGTFGIIISDHIDNYKLHNFDELRWVFRLNYGF